MIVTSVNFNLIIPRLKIHVIIFHGLNLISYTLIFSDYDKGPMSILLRCVKERLRVIVVIRAAVAVRSHCRGYVVAFDKHMNMVQITLYSKITFNRIV